MLRTALSSAVLALCALAPAHAASISLQQFAKTGVTAQIVPDSGEVGSSVNVYLGAMLGGKLYLRGSGSSDWRAYSSGAFPVAISGQKLSASTPITVTDLDATALTGLELYAAYGASESEALSKSGHLARIYPASPSGTARSFKGEVWVDNWFALYVNDKQVAEDSVPVTTERSFNSETFTFSASYPFELNFIVKDYKANDSGLEYIGTPQQQMGDGGFIAQITDTTTGKIVAVTSTAMRCLVIHKAPLNKTCAKDVNPTATCQSKIDAEPANWKNAGYDTSSWESASAYTETQIGVKEGYFNIKWDPSAKLIWTSDLLSDNTLLCKATVTGG